LLKENKDRYCGRNTAVFFFEKLSAILINRRIGGWMQMDYHIDTCINIVYNKVTIRRHTMQIIPMRDLKNTVEVERRCAEENGPVFVTKNGYGRLVVMDIEYYERTMQKMYEAKMIMEGLGDVRNNRTIEGDQALESIKNKYGI